MNIDNDHSQLWRQCVNWLVRCGAIPQDHRLASPIGTPNDFAIALRDGVLLCILLNRLRPNTVDLGREVNLRPQNSQFLCLSNLLIFKQYCQSKFGLSNRDIFDVYRLYQLQDFGEVLLTLSKLSNTQLALQRFRPGFPNEEPPPEDTYGVYNDTALEAPTRAYAEEKDLYGFSDSISDNISEGNYYDVEPTDDKPQDDRLFVLQELIQREKIFVDDMDNVVKDILPPLRPKMPPLDYERLFMFGNFRRSQSDESHRDLAKKSVFEALHSRHKRFLGQLDNAINKHGNNNERIIACCECFQYFKWFYHPYSYYMTHAQESIDLLDRFMKQSSQFKEEVEQLVEWFSNQANVRRVKRWFTMTSILQLPFHYVTKYGELLKRLRKECDQLAKITQRSTAHLLTSIQTATGLVEEFLKFTDRCAKDYEGLKAVQQLQKSIRGLPPAWNAAKAGQWIVDSELRTNFGANNFKSAYVFVFEYYMLLCRTGNAPQQYELEGIPIELAECTLQSPASDVPSKEIYWQLLSSDRTFNFACKTRPELQNWLDWMQLAIISYMVEYPSDLYTCKRCNDYIVNYGVICAWCADRLHYNCMVPEMDVCSIGYDIQMRALHPSGSFSFRHRF